MALTPYYRFCMKIGPASILGKKLADNNPDIEMVLAKANMNIRGEVFYTVAVVSTAFAMLGSLLLAAFLNILMLPSMGVEMPIRVMVWVLLPIILPAITFLVFQILPSNSIGERKKNIDRNLPYATNYMAAMASADVTPPAIFRGLADQPIYGEIQIEAEKIARDIDFF